jgi:hypothetical protein
MALRRGGAKAGNAIGGGLIVELRFPFANASADDHMAAALARTAKAGIRDGYAA